MSLRNIMLLAHEIAGRRPNRPETGTIEDPAIRGPEIDALPCLFASKSTKYKQILSGPDPLSKIFTKER